MNKTLVGGLTGALFALVALSLVAFRGGPFHHSHDPAEVAAFVTDRVDGALDDLDATPVQRAQIGAIKDRMLAAVQAGRDARQATHQAFLAEWQADQPDAAKLHALVDQRAAEMTAVAHQAVDAAIEVHGALTPDQRAKLTKKLERLHRQ